MEDTFLNNRINVIPRPLTIQELPGIFTLSNDTIIIATAGCENELRLFKNNLKEDFNFEFSDKTDSTSVIKLILNDNQVKDESYHLHVDVNKIEIIGWSTAGIFYGLQTLRQLINNEEKLTIPCVHIEDRPRFQWRSFMLDVARYFKNTSTIKQLLNEISQ
jgi:hexosaminidase